MSSSAVTKNDSVVVISGDDKGKRGKVLKIFPDKGKIIVEKVNLVKKHVKSKGPNTPGGIIEKEAAINTSNVLLYCSKCDRGVRISFQTLEDGTKERICTICGETISKQK
jgi:large subunit ribosomal protein L24